MKLAISIITAVNLGLTCAALADNFETLAAKGCDYSNAPK